MKKMILALFTISTMLILSSCGSDDPEKIEKSFKGTGLQSITLNSYPNVKVTMESGVAKLEDLLKGSEGYGAPIHSCSFSIKESAVRITGLKEGVILKGLGLKINGVEKTDFGDITNMTSELYNDKNLKYFQEVFAKISESKKVESSITFTSTDHIKPEDNVKLEIVLNGTFTYLVEVK